MDFFDLTTKVAHLLIPKVISLVKANLLTSQKNLYNLLLEGVQITISSVKRPLQQYLGVDVFVTFGS